MAESFVLFYYVKVMADVLSMDMMCLVFRALDLAALPKLGVPGHDGRWIRRKEVVLRTNRALERMGKTELIEKTNSSHRGSFVISLSFEDLFVKGGVYCAV